MKAASTFLLFAALCGGPAFAQNKATSPVGADNAYGKPENQPGKASAPDYKASGTSDQPAPRTGVGDSKTVGNGAYGNYDPIGNRHADVPSGTSHDFGWVGLLGLLGFAGLIRRERLR